MSESFTREELERAASRLGHILSMRKILDSAVGDILWTEERLRYWLGFGCEWLTEVVAEARRLREKCGKPHCRDGMHCRCESCHDGGVHSLFPDLSPQIANDDDTITVGELRAALIRNNISISRSQCDNLADRLAADIHAHREPDYPEGTVVQDADGKKWLRTGVRSWKLQIWSGRVYDNSEPRRPLAVI